MTAAEKALELVCDDQIVGLGTGRAATAFVRALGERVEQGLRVVGVPTSQVTADLASELGIPLRSMDEVATIDVTFDGADEVDPSLDLIKGYGGAMVREKIVASASRRLVILVGPEKLVAQLGSRGRLPVEVVPFGVALCQRRLEELGLPPRIREEAGKAYVTDNGNLVLDCKTSAIDEPEVLEDRILAIPGVVGTGLFVGMAERVIVGDGDRVDVKERAARA